MEDNQQSGALDQQGESHVGDNLNPDSPDSNSHIWIIEEVYFTYMTMVLRDFTLSESM